jgi:uncharacterized membrane protein YfcA
MEYLAVAITSLLASGLTFFSGFGLGTLLMPVLACFFPVSVAVPLTAIVHFLNNLFKCSLTGKHANKKIILHFGIPAVCTAAIGATLLFRLSAHPILIHYQLLSHSISVEVVKLVMAVLIISFAAAELSPLLEKKILPLQSPFWGGLLSGLADYPDIREHSAVQY